MAWLAVAASGLALWCPASTTTREVFSGLIVCDAFSLVFRWLIWGTIALTVALVTTSPCRREAGDVGRGARGQGEMLGLVLATGVGLMLMAESRHLLMAYVAIETVSLSSYLLVAFADEARSAEASMKYFLFGALSSGLMLFGMSLVFGLTGQLSFGALKGTVATMQQPMAGALVVAVALVLVGLAFKISMVPFHMWTPDAYEGAPIPVAALLSVGPKAAGLALVLRVADALSGVWQAFFPLMTGLAIVTMTLGNLAALAQTNIKRLLAYSTIAQVGYLLIGVVVGSPLAREGLVVYLAAYLFMNLGVFACAQAVVEATGSEALEAFRGLSRRAPALALVCAVFLLSLTGLPPLLGFFGKALLFGAALEAGQVALAVAGIINSVIALSYYVNIIRLMYLHGPVLAEPLRTAPAIRVAVAVCAAVTLLVGLFPRLLLERLHL